MKLLWFLLSICVGSPAMAGEWALLPQPKFAGHAAAWPVPGSEDMVLAVMAATPHGEPRPVSLLEIAEFPSVTREGILQETRAMAESLLRELPMREARDRRGVLEYLAIESENPWTAAVVLAPGFFQHFEKTIGPDAAAAIPNQHLVLVFPRSAPPAGLADLVFQSYHSTAYPVSREIFVPAAGGGIRPIGTTFPGARLRP